MDNQERNREALIDHIDEQDRIIRRRNEQIGGQADRIADVVTRKDELARELDAALTRAERAEGDLARYRAMHSEQIRTIVRLQENPRALTADDRSRACEAFREVWGRTGTLTREAVNAALDAALTEPTRPEEKVEAVLNQYWSGDVDGTDLAALIVEEMNR